MSNDKYLYHLNFARKYFFCQFGVWEYLWQRDWNMVVSSQSIRYRKELRLWQTYRICVQLVGWCDEDKSFYLESSFVANDSSGDSSGDSSASSSPFVHAVHWTKYRLLGRDSSHGSNSRSSSSSSSNCSSSSTLLGRDRDKEGTGVATLPLPLPSAVLAACAARGRIAEPLENNLHLEAAADLRLWREANAASSKKLRAAPAHCNYKSSHTKAKES
jgi:hypothetical protein